MPGQKPSPNRCREVGERLAANLLMIPTTVPQEAIRQRIVVPRTQWSGSWEFEGLAEWDEGGFCRRQAIDIGLPLSASASR